MYGIDVVTIDGILEDSFKAETMDEGYQRFDEACALYIDTEGQPAGSGGYFVNLYDGYGNVIAAVSQEEYISD